MAINVLPSVVTVQLRPGVDFIPLLRHIIDNYGDKADWHSVRTGNILDPSNDGTPNTSSAANDAAA